MKQGSFAGYLMLSLLVVTSALLGDGYTVTMDPIPMPQKQFAHVLVLDQPTPGKASLSPAISANKHAIESPKTYPLDLSRPKQTYVFDRYLERVLFYGSPGSKTPARVLNTVLTLYDTSNNKHHVQLIYYDNPSPNFHIDQSDSAIFAKSPTELSYVSLIKQKKVLSWVQGHYTHKPKKHPDDDRLLALFSMPADANLADPFLLSESLFNKRLKKGKRYYFDKKRRYLGQIKLLKPRLFEIKRYGRVQHLLLPDPSLPENVIKGQYDPYDEVVFVGDLDHDNIPDLILQTGLEDDRHEDKFLKRYYTVWVYLSSLAQDDDLVGLYHESKGKTSSDHPD